jgi:hypothetical protein
MDLMIEYNYAGIKLGDVQEFESSGSGVVLVTRTSIADYYRTWHNIDLALNFELNKWLSFSLGPTVSATYRTISYVSLWNQTYSFDDRVASLCAGLNSSFNVEVPLLDGERYLFLFSRVTFRYLHSLLFDARGRNLDNYSQEFITGQVNVGAGFCF